MSKKKTILNIWHGVKHDDAAVTTIEFPLDLANSIREIQMRGGFYATEDGKMFFTPYHKINYIEVL